MSVDFAVVIPTCQRPQYLSWALASVRKQTLSPREIIVVNDHPDEVAIEDSGVVVLPFSEERGASASRNRGAQLSRASWIAFLDDDDEWESDYLEQVANTIASSKPNIVLTSMNILEGTSLKPGKEAPAELVAHEFLVRNPGLIGSNLCIERSHFDAVGRFDPSLRALTDMDIGYRIACHPETRYGRQVERRVRHRRHEGDRICTPRGANMTSGVRSFYAKHRNNMTAPQRDVFVRHMLRLWGVDLTVEANSSA